MFCFVVLQSQTLQIFNAISCGQTEKVLELIKGGDVFDPNNETKLTVLMEEHVKLARDEFKRSDTLKDEVHKW